MMVHSAMVVVSLTRRPGEVAARSIAPTHARSRKEEKASPPTPRAHAYDSESTLSAAPSEAEADAEAAAAADRAALGRGLRRPGDAEATRRSAPPAVQ